MTITHVKGDLLDLFRDDKVNVILHVANCQGIMGSGIAAQIKARYLVAYKRYKDHEHSYGLELGTISYAQMTTSRGIFNLHAQQLYGVCSRFLNYEALYKCLEAVSTILTGRKIIIGIPMKMGSDRAGGDWRIVEKMIEVVFENTQHEIIIVDYDKIDR